MRSLAHTAQREPDICKRRGYCEINKYFEAAMNNFICKAGSVEIPPPVLKREKTRNSQYRAQQASRKANYQRPFTRAYLMKYIVYGIPQKQQNAHIN